MIIQPSVQQGIPSPSLVVVFDDICGAKNTNELLFVLSKWMDINFEEPTNLTSWVLVLNKLDALMAEIIGRTRPLLVLPETRGELAVPPPEDPRPCLFECYALVIVLRFSSLLLHNATNKDIYASVEHLMVLLRAYDDDVSRLALECVLSLVTPPPTQRCLTFTNHVTAMHKNASLCLPLFQLVEFSRSVSSCRVADFLAPSFSSEEAETPTLVFSMLSKSRHARSAAPSSGETGPEAAVEGDVEGRILEIPNFFESSCSIQEVLTRESWFPIDNAFPLLTQMRALRAVTSLDGRKNALRKMYQAILILLCCHPSSATLSDFFHDKTEILLDFIYLLRSGPGTPEYSDWIPFDIRVLACQSLIAVVGSRDVSSVSIMGRFSWLQHDLGVNKGQYMGLLPCLLRSAATFLASRHENSNEYASEISVADTAVDANTMSWADRVARAVLRVDHCESPLTFSSMLVQTPPTGLMTVADLDKIKAAIKSKFPSDSVVTAATLRAWILASQDVSPVYSSDHQVQYSPVYLTRLLWTEQILILTTAVISATSALPALVDSGFIALIVGVIADPSVRDHTDLQLSYIEATMIQMLELSISDSSTSMNIFREMNGADTLLERLLFEINDGRFLVTDDAAPAAGSSSDSKTGAKRKFSELVEGETKIQPHNAATKTERDFSPHKVGPGTVYIEKERELAGSLRSGVHLMLPSTSVVIHSLLSALSIYLQEGGDSRQSHLLRGKKFSVAMNILFKNSRFLASPVFAFAFSILSEVINNDPGFLGYIVNNGLAKLALECCDDLDINRFAIGSFGNEFASVPDSLEPTAPLNDALFQRKSRALLVWPDLTAELITSMTSFLSAVALTKDGLDLIGALNPFEGLFASFMDFRGYSPFSSTMMNDLPRSIGASMEDLIRHYPVLSEQCMRSLLDAMGKVASIVETSDAVTLESTTPEGVSHLMYVHATTGLLQCLNQILARKSCVEYFLKDTNGVELVVRLLKVGMSAPRSFLAALAASTEPTTNSLGHHPIVKSASQCFISISQHEPKRLSEQLFRCLKTEYSELNSSLNIYWEIYENGAAESNSCTGERVAPLKEDNLKHFLDSISRKRLHQCFVDGKMPPLLVQFTGVLRRFVVLNYIVENLAAVLQIISSRAQSRYAAAFGPLITNEDSEILNTIINKLYVSSQEELCAARGNLMTGNKRAKPKAHPIYRLLIISHEHVVVRTSLDADVGKKVGKLPKGAIVDAFERCTGKDNSLKYRIKEGWIGFYRNNLNGDPQVEVIELLEKSPVQLAADEAEAVTSLDTAQKKFDFEKYANVSPRRGGFMTMFHFHCCTRHLLSVASWSFLPPPGKPFPDQTYVLLPLIASCLANLLPQIATEAKTESLPAAFAAGFTSDADTQFVRDEFPSPEVFTISDSFRTIHAVELCHHLLFDEKRGHGETNILLLMHLFRSGFIEKLLHASTLVFLTCLHPETGGSFMPSSSHVAVAEDGIAPPDVDPTDDDVASDCSSDADEEVKRDWHLKRVLKERRMLAVTNIEIVVELWKLFFGSFSLSSHASTLLKEVSDETHEFDITVLKHELYCLQVKYLFQTWSHPRLYTLPPTSVRHVLELVNIISKALFNLSSDRTNTGGRAGLSMGGRNGNRMLQTQRGATGGRGMPFSLQQLLSGHGGMDIIDFSEREGNITIGTGVGAMEVENAEAREEDMFGSSLGGVMRQRARSNSAHSNGSRGRRRGFSGSAVPLAPQAATEQVSTLPRLEHILPVTTKQTAEMTKIKKDLVVELCNIVFNSVPVTCIGLVSRGIKAAGVQWRTEAAILNQNLTREDTTIMILTMMSRCLESSKWTDTLRCVVLMTSILEPIVEIVKHPLTLSSASRLYGLLHALVIVLTGNKFDVLFLLLSRSPRYRDLPSLLIELIEHRQLAASGLEFDGICITESLWITPALLLLDSLVQPILFDKANLSLSLKELIEFTDASTKGTLGGALGQLLPSQFLQDLISEFGVKVDPKKRQRSGRTKSSGLNVPSNDLEISGFIEKHGELEPDASAADINAIKETITGVPEKNEKSNDSLGSDSNFLLPLFENGLDSALRVRCAHVCVDLLRLCGSPDVKNSTFVQAVCQLLSHLTRERSLAEIFQSSLGLEKLLNVKLTFDGSSAFVFTLILHILEDDQYLLHSMDATIKVCLHRMKSSSASKALSLKSFVETLAPLMYRNQAIFLEAARKCIRLKSSGGGQFVVIAADDVIGTPSSPKAAPASTEAVERDQSSDHIPKFRNARSGTGTNLGSGVTPEPVALKEILEVLVQKLFEQWSVATSENADSPDSKRQCLLSMADTITILADLVCTVPGFATSIHKCQYSPMSKNKPTTARSSAFEAVLAQMKHCITGEKMHSTHFITFLVHYLLSCDVFIPHGTATTSSPSTSASPAVIRGVDTKVLKDAVCYLLVALISRPGDGRRRILKEILGGLKLAGVPVDTNNKLRVVSSLVQCMQCILSPKPAWKQRSLLTVPYKDIIMSVVSLKAYGILSEALFAVSVNHPFSLQVSEQISAPLEFLIRKGLPMYDDSLKSEKESALVSDKPASGHESTRDSSSNGIRAISRGERPPTAPRGSSSRPIGTSNTPGSALSSARAGGGGRGDYDFFSPLVSSSAVDRRDTMTTDDDRDLDRLEHHGTLENDLRLLAQPSQSSGPLGVGGMLDTPGGEMDDDEDDEGEEVDLESILSSGSEDGDDEDEDDFDEEEVDEEDDEDDDLIVDEDEDDEDDDFDEHTLDGDDEDDHSEDEHYVQMDDGDGNTGGAIGHPADMEISITIEPHGAEEVDPGGGRPAGSSTYYSADFPGETAGRLLEAGSSSSRGAGDMRPPTRRLTDDAGRSRNFSRAYESMFHQADIDDGDEADGYDSAFDMYDGREQDELIHAAIMRGDNEDEDASEWVTINHGDDDDGGDYPDDDHYATGPNNARAFLGSGVGNRGRPRLSEIMESLHTQGRGGAGMGGGAVRIAGEDLMGFLGNLPLPDFLRDSLAGGGEIRHMVAHIPVNGEMMEHGEGAMFGSDGGGFPGGVRDALHSLMRPSRGPTRDVLREGASSNPAPSRHPLVDVSLCNNRSRGGISGRSRSGSFIDAVISAVDGSSSVPDGISSEEKQQMKTVITQRRRLLGSLISDRRWGTDIGDRDITISRFNSLCQSLVRYYEITGGDNIISGDNKDVTNGGESESAFRSQFSNAFGPGGRAERLTSADRRRRYLHLDESKEETELQESKEDSDSVFEDDESSNDELQESPEPVIVADAAPNSALTSERSDDGGDEAAGLETTTGLSGDSVESDAMELILSNSDALVSAPPAGIDSSAAREASVATAALNQCPDGYDPDVWASLPRELQLEVLGDERPAQLNHSEETAMLDQTELDRAALEALPAAMRSEILREEVVERRRRESFDQSNANSLDISAVVSTFGTQIGADLQSSDGNTTRQPSAAHENYLFITSLPTELRQEALLGADAEFIASLPQSIRQEAEALRSRHQVHVESHPSAVSNTLAPQQRQSNTAAGGAAAAAGEVYQRLYSQLLSGAGADHRGVVRRNAPRNEDNAEEKEVELHPTTVFFQDDREGPPPFGPRLVSRILHYVVSGTSTRLSRVLTRLLCALCRYQTARLPILRALTCVLMKDAPQATICLLQIPREPYKTYPIRNLQQCTDSPSVLNLSVSRSDPDESLLVEMKAIASALSRANQVQGTLCVRRLLHLVGSLVKHTDRLVWYDIMNQGEKKCEDSIEANSVSAQLSSSSSDKAAPEWMFQKLISLLGDQRVLQECDIDSVLYLLGELCEPLSRLTVGQVSDLVKDQMSATPAAPAKSVTERPADMISAAGTSSVASVDDATLDPAPKRRRIEMSQDLDASTSSSVIISGNADSSMDVVGTADVPISVVPDGDADDEIRPDAGHLESNMPFPVLSAKSVELLALLAKSEYCGGPGRNRLSRIMCTLSLFDGNWKQLVKSLSNAAEGLVCSTEGECRTMLAVLTKVVNRNGSAADATSLPELSTPSSVSESRLLRVFRLMGSLRNTIDGPTANPASNATGSTIDVAPMTLSGTVEERAFVAEHISGIDFGSLWDLLCKILDQIRGLEGINEEINAEASSAAAPTTAAMHSASSINASTAQPVATKQPFLSSLTMRFMPLIECYMTVSGATLLRMKPSGPVEQGGSLRSMNSFAALDGALASTVPQTPSGSLHLLGAPSTLFLQKVSVPGARFRQHKAYADMHMDIIESPESARFLQFAEANKSLLNMILRQNTHLLESSFSPFVLIPRLRSLLHFDIKRAYFKLKLKKLKQSGGRNYGSLRVAVHRSSVMEDSFQKLRFSSAEEMRKRLSITFLGEDGIDAGGLTREWFSLLAKEIFNVNYCLFTATHDNVTFQPNPYSGINPDHLDYFKFVGRIIGKAICDGHLLDAHFTRSFYKHMLGIPVGYQDLEALEPEYFKSLMAIIEHPLDLLGLDLSFSAELNEFGRVEVVDLIENGRNIPVTDENKSDYIRLIANHRMTNSIRKQIDAFLEGFHDTIPPELISIFDAQELELVISGLPDIDLDDLRAHTEYQGYKSTDPVINFFWSALRTFSKEEKALFLQFVTGTSKVPLEGFQALYGARGPQQFNIHKAYGTHLLPSAHTCFNQLDLPEYGTEDELREKLLIALHEGSEGFGFA